MSEEEISLAEIAKIVVRMSDEQRKKLLEELLKKGEQKESESDA